MFATLLGRVKEKVVLPQAPASTFLTRVSKVYAAMDFSSVDKMESQSTETKKNLEVVWKHIGAINYLDSKYLLFVDTWESKYLLFKNIWTPGIYYL